tara:strand:+ start:408 stop:551 length:144 start_codon:yes stop_codon:yes gene_type:complete
VSKRILDFINSGEFSILLLVVGIILIGVSIYGWIKSKKPEEAIESKL